MFWNRYESNQNKKSAFRNKTKLKVNILFCNGLGRQHGHGHGHGYGHGRDFYFGLNRYKPKLDLFWFCFGLFHGTKKNFQFVSKRNEKIGVSKQTKTED
jgi:hypothetical protein